MLAALATLSATAAAAMAPNTAMRASWQPATCTDCRAPAPIALAAREARLHTVARRATLDGNNYDAQRAYELAISEWGSSRSFLLMALLQSRMGFVEEARGTFREGIATHPTDSSLMQAWGLFESKQGELQRAVRLLNRAVALDPSKAQVLRWRPFRATAQACGFPSMRPANIRVRAAPSMMSSSATQDPPPAALLSLVPRPACRYTIPQAKRGWRGREDKGEDPTKWYDDEGVRNGPPQNYWRQAMDERMHRNAMSALDAVLSGTGGDDEVLRKLEYRMPIAKPLRNRKLLGTWAPLLLNGKVLASAAVSAECGIYTASPELRIRRKGDRRTFEHRYGVFDEHMDEGEELLVELGTEEAAESAPSTATIDNGARRSLPLTLPELPGVGAVGELHLGGVTLLNEYMLLARDPESGELVDCWMRVDEPEQP